MKKIISINLLLIITLCSNCTYDPPEKKIIVYNETDSTIYVYWACSDSITREHPLELFQVYKGREKDIIFGRVKDSLIVSPNYRINPHVAGGIGTTGQEALLNLCPDKKLRIFYISEGTIRTKSWEEIVENQIYIKKETFTIEKLKEYDWTIEYK